MYLYNICDYSYSPVEFKKKIKYTHVEIIHLLGLTIRGSDLIGYTILELFPHPTIQYILQAV